MAGTIRNLSWFRSVTDKTNPGWGTRLYEALTDVYQNQKTITQQANLNPSGSPQAPPQVNGMKVQAQNGHFQVSIQDANPSLFRGVQYYVEHADNPNFNDSHIESLHDSRNANLFLGNTTRYFRAYSSYSSSAISSPVYHGSQASPIAVTGGGSIGGPNFLPSESSGTSLAGEGLSGPGSVPFRSSNGKPPVR